MSHLLPPSNGQKVADRPLTPAEKNRPLTPAEKAELERIDRSRGFLDRVEEIDAKLLKILRPT